MPQLSPWFGVVFIGAVVFLVGIFNTLAALDDVPNNTISAWYTLISERYIAAAYALPGALGHWASRWENLPEVPGGPIPFLCSVLVVLLVDLLTGGYLSRYPFWLAMLAGIVAGAVLWPMSSVAN